MQYRKNLGILDRGLRFMIGSLFAYFGFIDHSIIKDVLAGALLGGMGVIFMATATLAYCPMYVLIDFSTVRDKR